MKSNAAYRKDSLWALIVPVLFFCGGLLGLQVHRDIASRWVVTHGTVIDVVKGPGFLSTTTFEYESLNEPGVLTTATVTQYGWWTVGDEAPLHFDPYRKESCTAGGWWIMNSVPVLFFVFAAVDTALVLLVLPKHMRRVDERQAARRASKAQGQPANG